MGPSPEKLSTGDTTSWRLCLANSRGALKGTGGTWEEEGNDTGGTGSNKEQSMDIPATSWLLPALSSKSFIITQTCLLVLQPTMGGTQSGTEVVLPHHAGSLPQQPCSCHHTFLTSDIDLDFPAVLAPGGGDSALPEPCVCLCQVPHLKLAGDLLWLDDGFDDLQHRGCCQPLHSAPGSAPHQSDTPQQPQILLRKLSTWRW